MNHLGDQPQDDSHTVIIPEALQGRLLQMPRTWALYALRLVIDDTIERRPGFVSSASHLPYLRRLPPLGRCDDDGEPCLRCVELKALDDPALDLRCGPLNAVTYFPDGRQGFVTEMHREDLVLAVEYSQRAFVLRRDWIRHIWQSQAASARRSWSEVLIPVNAHLRRLHVFEFLLHEVHLCAGAGTGDGGCSWLNWEICGSDDAVAPCPRTMRSAGLLEEQCTTEHDRLHLAPMKITAEPAAVGLESFLEGYESGEGEGQTPQLPMHSDSRRLALLLYEKLMQ